jgi:hypothetical protein
LIRAGIEPRIEKLNGHDPVAYILSSNDRRDMTQGQRAVVAAMINSNKLLEFGDRVELARSLKVPPQRVSEAVIIVRHAPDLAERVRVNEMPGQRAVAMARRSCSKLRRRGRRPPTSRWWSRHLIGDRLARLVQLQKLKLTAISAKTFSAPSYPASAHRA